MTASINLLVGVLLAGAPTSSQPSEKAITRTTTLTENANIAFPKTPGLDRQKLPLDSEVFGNLVLDLSRQTAETDDGTFVLSSSLLLVRLADAPALKGVKPEDHSTILAAVISELMNSLAEGVVKSINGKIVEKKQIQVGVAKGMSLAGPVLGEGDEASGASFLAHVVVSETLTLYVALAVTGDDKAGREKAAAFVNSLAFSTATTVTKTSNSPGHK